MPSRVIVSGKDATQPITGAGLAPIAWSAPSIRSASRYAGLLSAGDAAPFLNGTGAMGSNLFLSQTIQP